MQKRELSAHAAHPVQSGSDVHGRSGGGFSPPTAMRSAVTDVTEPLREAEERFRQALHSASLSSTASYAPQKDATPNLPPPPIVQMLIDKLGAVILPKE
jgi:hypothetical protein